MKNKEVLDVVFLLDRSGSMSGMESDTIGGYNNYLKGMRKQNAKITTVLFDNQYEMVNQRENVANVKNMNNKIYFTRGSTALLDAIGKTIEYMDSQKPRKVMFIITTDGLENSSVEYNKGQIKELILGHKDWEFVYLGADIDSYEEAQSIGIGKNRTSNYTKSKKGMGKLFSNLKNLCVMYEESNCVKDNWKDGLEDYINDNIE